METEFPRSGIFPPSGMHTPSCKCRSSHIQKEPSADVLQHSCSEKFRKINKKANVLKPFFNNVVTTLSLQIF